MFTVGSAHDPEGKEGLAALTAAMLTRGGSKALGIEQIDEALHPKASSFTAQTDKEMTTLTGNMPRDHWRQFVDVALPQLLNPGWRPDDFTRLKARQMNALVQDLRSDNEEELAKERLQGNVFRGTRYEHVSLGTVAGLNAITLDDVKAFAGRMYTRANLTLGAAGDVPKELQQELQDRLARLPDGPAAARPQIEPPPLSGIRVEILEKDSRATAISLGFPIAVTRSHPDFAALSVARSWLGEHRMPFSHLYQRIREVRGMNYGDYAYIEAFPGGMFRFFPDPNVGRRHQIFEMWIRPVSPDQAQMALKIALHEFRKMVADGLTQEQFDTTRAYLAKNVAVMTARQDQQLGYALDSRWYEIVDFTEYMRTALARLTREQVNAAIRRHFSSDGISIVIVCKDAAALKQALVEDRVAPVRYDAEKPRALLDEDAVIGAEKLGIAAASVQITPIAEVFAR
jgi:zinc protease